jgi:cytoskeletal protein RodZ
MKKTILISALVATGLSTAAFAQEAGTPAPTAPDATTPSTDTTTPGTTTPAPDATMPSTTSPDATAPGMTSPDATTTSPDATTPAPSAAMPSDTGSAILMDQQVDGQRLGTKLMGAAVYSTTGDHIGDINDLIVGSDGMVRGYLVGVGGFLGIGEKNVAISYGAVSSSVDDSGNPRLVVNLTKDQLTDAPAFNSADRS